MNAAQLFIEADNLAKRLLFVPTPDAKARARLERIIRQAERRAARRFRWAWAISEAK